MSKEEVSFEEILKIFREEEEIPDDFGDEDLLKLPLSAVDQMDLFSGFPLRMSVALKESGIFIQSIVIDRTWMTVKDLLEGIQQECIRLERE